MTDPRSVTTATVDYSQAYDPDADFDAIYTLATGRRIANALHPRERILELGCATGLMTTLLASAEREILAVDRSGPYLDRLRHRGLPGVRSLLGDVEQLEPPGRFDHVLMTNLLHEVRDPAAMLRSAVGWLTDGGRVHVTVPNPRSLHRLIALDMGLIDSLEQLSARGQRLGTRRMIDADTIAEMATASGLRIAERAGILLKPLPNDAMATLDESALAAFETTARLLPDHCAMSYLVLQLADG